MRVRITRSFKIKEVHKSQLHILTSHSVFKYEIQPLNIAKGAQNLADAMVTAVPPFVESKIIGMRRWIPVADKKSFNSAKISEKGRSRECHWLWKYSVSQMRLKKTPSEAPGAVINHRYSSEITLKDSWQTRSRSRMSESRPPCALIPQSCGGLQGWGSREWRCLGACRV